jgi:hypothetical protein
MRPWGERTRFYAAARFRGAHRPTRATTAAKYNPGQADADSDGIGDACDNKPPDCTAARADVRRIWPPNHEWTDVTAIGVSDPERQPVSIVVTAVRQDEPVNGRGDGDTSPDGVLLDGKASVRAERQGGGDGRVYHVSFTATDAAGGTCTGTVKACVPNSASQTACVDGGPLYDSLETASGGRR